MTKSVLIGKGRRVTLDELESIASQNGAIEMQVTDDITDMSFDESFITSAISSLSLDNDATSLSIADTKACLTFLANFVAQSRLMRSSTCLNMSTAAAIAYIVNNNNILRLPSSPESFIEKLAAIVPEKIQEHLNAEQMKANLPVVLARIIPLAITSLATHFSLRSCKEAERARSASMMSRLSCVSAGTISESPASCNIC